MAESTIPSAPAGSPAALIQVFVNLPASRQAVLLVALAACLASVIGIVVWARTPDFSLLYGSLDERDTAQVAAALEKAGIPYRLDAATGAVRVPSTTVHEARMKLAAEGLPKGSGSGLEILAQGPSFGVSSFMENARYRHALEGELVRTITAIAGVQQARVHLAIPERSVFVRGRDKPSASVMLQLYRGRTLDEGQVAAIVHLVSSSVPDLAPARVTVVDQDGTLLTRPNGQQGIERSTEQYEYTRRLELDYAQRIEDLLAAVVGPGRVRAKVSAEVDFEVVERTLEQYDPNRVTLRSSQEEESESSSGTAGAASGVPGTLSNQPPPGGTLVASAPITPEANQAAAAPTNALAAQGAAAPTPSNAPRDRSRRSVRNFEIDRTISHSKLAGGAVKRLTVAVVIDDHLGKDETGKQTRVARTPEELDRYTALVKDAVGFNAERGDSINVINATFAPTEPAPTAETAPVWQQSWLWQAMRLLLAAGALAAVLLGVLRPLLRSVRQAGAAVIAQVGPTRSTSLPAPQAELTTAAPQLVHSGESPPLPDLHQADPQRVMQVMRNWMAADA